MGVFLLQPYTPATRQILRKLTFALLTRTTGANVSRRNGTPSTSVDPLRHAMKMKTYFTPTCSVRKPQQIGPMMGPMRGPEGGCEWVLRGCGTGERMG